VQSGDSGQCQCPCDGEDKTNCRDWGETRALSVAAGQDKSTLVTMPALRGPGESEKYAGKRLS
jgi:hypothetical protein